MSETRIQIILPEADDDAVSEGIRELTEALAGAGFDTGGMGLGGEFGYGVAYENDTFMMHPFCWCERADCPWCRECECVTKAFPDGTYTVVSECENCRNPQPTAPHFRHKASGFEVRWYKYIGRDMRVTNPNGVAFSDVLGDCLKSINSGGSNS